MLSFLLGLGIAIFIFGGIMLGVKFLLSVQERSWSPAQYRWRMILSVLLLVGQFVGACALLYFSDLRTHQPLALAAGLISGIFSLYALMKIGEK